MEPDNIEIAIRGSLALFVLKEFWLSLKGRGKENEIALKSNTEALIELKSEMKYFNRSMHEISERVKRLEEK